MAPHTRRETTSGQMLNLMQTNTKTVVDMLPYLNMIWSAPLQIAISLIILWQYLKLASLASVLVIALLVPLNIFVTTKMRMYQLKKLKLQDSRIKLTNELLSGIKVIKMYGWEVAFQKLVNKIRLNEMTVLKKIGFCDALLNLNLGSVSFLVIFILRKNHSVNLL